MLTLPLKNYTVIHGNIMYNIDNVEYRPSETHRRFKRGFEVILSVPLNSTLIERGQGVSAKMLAVTQPTESLTSMSGTSPVVSNEGSDNFIEGVIAGAIVNEIIFN
jgi:hypothetical protein